MNFQRIRSGWHPFRRHPFRRHPFRRHPFRRRRVMGESSLRQNRSLLLAKWRSQPSRPPSVPSLLPSSRSSACQEKAPQFSAAASLGEIFGDVQETSHDGEELGLSRLATEVAHLTGQLVGGLVEPQTTENAATRGATHFESFVISLHLDGVADARN